VGEHLLLLGILHNHRVKRLYSQAKCAVKQSIESASNCRMTRCSFCDKSNGGNHFVDETDGLVR